MLPAVPLRRRPPGRAHVPRAFALQVRDALAHLHDLPYLAGHPLAREADGVPARAGRALHARLLEAIGSLRARPGDGPGDRTHRLLELRYVEALTSAEVCARLGVSQGEYYRAHQRGVAAVASLLGPSARPDPLAPTPPGPSASVSTAAPGAAFRGAAPRPLTSFIGRSGEIAEVARLVATSRLVTLMGSGGCGKTRLAVEAVASLVDRFADGGCFVDFAPGLDETLVPLAALAALGVRDRQGIPARQALVDHLRGRDLLLVLDNCEHLVGACARLTEELLGECPRLRMLATSREPLGVPGESTWRVPSLSVPDPAEPADAAGIGQHESVRLFVERAQLVDAGFRLTDQNAGAVAQVCARLDGIPLAIELAAVRVRVLPVEQIAARLDRSFDILTAGGRTAPARQQTLRALIDWSHELLAEDERVLLRRLAVFVGGFSLEAAEAVAGVDPLPPARVLGLLAGLVDKSLVGVETDGGRAVYRLLETIRQYADEKLRESGEAEATRSRQRDWWLAQSRIIAADGIGLGGAARGGRERLRELEPMRDDLRAVLASCAGPSGDAQIGLVLSREAAHMWPSYTEQRHWIETFLRLAPERTAARGRALLFLDHLLRWQREHAATALAFAREAVEIFREVGDAEYENRARADVAMSRANSGDHARAIAELEHCLAEARRDGHHPRMVQYTRDLGLICIADGQLARARARLEESLALVPEDGLAVGAALLRLGIVDRLEGNYARARARVEEAQRARDAEAVQSFTVWALTWAELANIARAEGRLEEARAGMTDVLRTWLRRRFDAALGELLCMLAMVEIDRGELERGVRLIAACSRGPGPIGTIHVPDVRVEAPGYLARARAPLGDAAYADAWTAGQAMTREQAIACAVPL